jgi:hypothetical protein
VATLAYRAHKVLQDVPDHFSGMRPSRASRSPLEVLSHMCDLMEWAVRLSQGEDRWHASPSTDWGAATERFFRGTEALEAALVRDPLDGAPTEKLFQGPIADALMHVGQLAMMRGMFGLAVRPESYARAPIQAGRAGRSQPGARVEFQGDASRPLPDGSG